MSTNQPPTDLPATSYEEVAVKIRRTSLSLQDMAEHDSSSTDDKDKPGPLPSSIPESSPLLAGAGQVDPATGAFLQRRSKLPSYVSEPPSTLLMMRAMAQEELGRQQQPSASPSASVAGSEGNSPLAQDIPSFGGFSATGGDGGSLELSNRSSTPDLVGSVGGLGGSPAAPLEKTDPPAAAATNKLTGDPFELLQSQHHNLQRPASVDRDDKLRSNLVWFNNFTQGMGRPPDGTLEHTVAGDLAIGSAGKNRVTFKGDIKGQAREKSPVTKQPASGKPAAASTAPAKPAVVNVPAPKPAGRRSIDKGGHDSDDDSPLFKWGDDPDLEEGVEIDSTPLYKRKKFWMVLIPILISIAFIIAGTIILVYNPESLTTNFQTWRLCFFIAGLPIIWWIGTGVSHASVWLVERSLFTVKNALYYAYAVRRPLKNVLRAVLALGWWAGMMTIDAGAQSEEVKKAYNTILKVWACVTLFMTANLLKTLLAKILASKFNRESHLKKMHVALEKEYLLHTLLQPREESGILETGNLDGFDENGKPINDDGAYSTPQGGGGGGPQRYQSPFYNTASDGTGSQEQPTGKKLWLMSRPSMPALLRRLSSRESSGGKLGQTQSAGEVQLGSSSTGGGGGGGKSSLGFGFWSSKSSKKGGDRSLNGKLDPIDEAQDEEGSGDEYVYGKKVSPGETPSSPGLLTIKIDNGLQSPTHSSKSNTPKGQVGSTLITESISFPIKSSNAAGAAGGGGGSVPGSPRRSTSFPQTKADPSSASAPLPILKLPSGKLVYPRSTETSPTGSPRYIGGGGGNTSPLYGSSKGSPPGKSPLAAAAAAPAAPGLGKSPPKNHPKVVGLDELRRVGSLKSAAAAGVGGGIGKGGQGGGLQRTGSMQSTLSVKSRQAAQAAATRRLAISGEARGSVINKMVKLEKHIRNNALKITFRDELNRSYKIEAVTSEAEAKKLSFYLFWNIKRKFDEPAIRREELSDFIQDEDSLNEAFTMLDDDKDGRITIEDVKNAVLKIYTERKNLAASLQDTRSIVSVLESLIGFIIHLIFIFFYLLIFNLDVGELYTSLSALILGFSFIFGNSVRQMYENVVFLFVVHPYDVGDLLEINKAFYKVDEITLNFTCFSTPSGQKVWMPNYKLQANDFINVTNSTDRGEAILILVDFDTPPTVLDELNTALEQLVKDNSQEFGSAGVNLREGMNPMKMTLAVFYTFTHNGADLARTGAARTKIYICVGELLKRLGVQYSWPSMRYGPNAGTDLGPGVIAAANGDPQTSTTMGLGI